MKKILSFTLVITIIISCISLLAGCGSKGNADSNGSKGAKKGTIGIIQFGTHESLNNCYDGIIKGLKESVNLDDYDVEYLNSNFTAETSLSQANKLVNKKADVIVAIATPSAIMAATAAEGKDIPVVYCAVTDASQVANFSNMTGTSDIPDFEAQLKLVSAFFNKTDVKIGILSSTEESSDDIQIDNLNSAAKAYDEMEIIVEKVADITTIDAKTNALVAKKVDCIVNLLDSTIVGKLSNILAITDKAGIPVFGSEIEQVKNGCLAAASIDYVTVGKLAGNQAAEILGGKKASEVAPKTMENETFPCYNSSVLEKFKTVTLPKDIENLKDVNK